MLEGWSSELDTVIWLDAPDQVLWGRINERAQGHRKKGREPEVGHRFIADYRRSFENVLRRMDELGGPQVLRFDTGEVTPEHITETVRPLLLADRSAEGVRSVPATGSGTEGNGVVENLSDRKMRVLHVIIMLGETNGQYNEHCLPLMHERDISIVTYFIPKLTPPPEITLFAGDGTLRGFFRVLKNALNAQEYDVVHAHAPQTGSLLVLGALAWRRFGRLRSSLVYTVQDSFNDYTPRNRAMMAVSLAAFTRIVFCSRSAYESLPRRLKRLVRGRWRVVQNGADLDRIDRAIASRPTERDERGFTVVSVGRLERVKDPLLVLEAFSRSVGGDAGSRAVFVGEGRLSSIVTTRARELGLQDRIVLTGLIPRDDVFVICADADVFVSTSHGEGLPVAVLEAMAAACPVILSDIPPHREVADGADFIPFVAPGDVEGFAAELKRFHGMTREERRDIGRSCRAHVAARFTLPIMRAGTEAVYREVASGVGGMAPAR
jgi:glycosyltransferase involved in cell wall biosynthesis